jgi:hypothetical protein
VKKYFKRTLQAAPVIWIILASGIILTSLVYAEAAINNASNYMGTLISFIVAVSFVFIGILLIPQSYLRWTKENYDRSFFMKMVNSRGMPSSRFLRRLKAFASFLFMSVQFLAVLITILVTLGGLALFAWLQRNLNLPVILTLLALAALATTSVILFRSSSFISLFKSSSSSWVLRGYRSLKSEYTYEINEADSNQHTLISQHTIETLHSGVSIFEDSYQWLGKGSETKPMVLSRGHILMGEAIKRSGWNYYYIYLGRELSKRETDDIKVQQEFIFHEDVQQFFSKVVSMPTNKLVLHLILPTHSAPYTVYFREWNTDGPASRLLRQIPGTLYHKNHKFETRWEIQDPILGHRYEISWQAESI